MTAKVWVCDLFCELSTNEETFPIVVFMQRTTELELCVNFLQQNLSSFLRQNQLAGKCRLLENLMGFFQLKIYSWNQKTWFPEKLDTNLLDFYQCSEFEITVLKNQSESILLVEIFLAVI